jgi:hypothetical protein
MDLYQMFCERLDNDSGYDNAKLAKDLIAMIPGNALNKVASSQHVISESEANGVCDHPHEYLKRVDKYITHCRKCDMFI